MTLKTPDREPKTPNLTMDSRRTRYPDRFHDTKKFESWKIKQPFKKFNVISILNPPSNHHDSVFPSFDINKKLISTKIHESKKNHPNNFHYLYCGSDTDLENHVYEMESQPTIERNRDKNHLTLPSKRKKSMDNNELISTLIDTKLAKIKTEMDERFDVIEYYLKEQNCKLNEILQNMTKQNLNHELLNGMQYCAQMKNEMDEYENKSNSEINPAPTSIKSHDRTQPSGQNEIISNDNATICVHERESSLDGGSDADTQSQKTKTPLLKSNTPNKLTSHRQSASMFNIDDQNAHFLNQLKKNLNYNRESIVTNQGANNKSRHRISKSTTILPSISSLQEKISKVQRGNDDLSLRNLRINVNQTILDSISIPKALTPLTKYNKDLDAKNVVELNMFDFTVRSESNQSEIEFYDENGDDIDDNKCKNLLIKEIEKERKFSNSFDRLTIAK